MNFAALSDLNSVLYYAEGPQESNGPTCLEEHSIAVVCCLRVSGLYPKLAFLGEPYWVRL